MPSTHALTLTPVGDRDLRFSRAFKAPRALVFEALITPDLIRRWMLGPDGWSMPVCEVDARPGGRFRYVWHNNGREFAMSGTFRELTAPSRIVHTELFDEDWTGGETLVTTVLDEADGWTTMTTEVRYSSEAARAGALKTGMVDGMTVSYDRLAAMVETA